MQFFDIRGKLEPQIFIDGDQWCVLMGLDLEQGVSGFGSSPALAMADFNHNWSLPIEREELDPAPNIRTQLPVILQVGKGGRLMDKLIIKVSCRADMDKHQYTIKSIFKADRVIHSYGFSDELDLDIGEIGLCLEFREEMPNSAKRLYWRDVLPAINNFHGVK